VIITNYKEHVLFTDSDGTTYSVDIPLTSNVKPEELRENLNLPSYIDLNYHAMKSVMVILWACVNAHKLHEWYPQVFKKRVSKNPIPALVFGGAAIKIHCMKANMQCPIARELKDADFVVPRNQGEEFFEICLNLDKLFGTMYKSFATLNDKRFNWKRAGERYRFTTINDINNNGIPKIGVVDVFCNRINLRHKIEIEDAFKFQKQNLYTIGLENLILSKTQYILDLPRETVEELKQHEQEHRILSYPYYARDKIIIGMEDKDIKDVCAILLDHEIGTGNDMINLEVMKKKLKGDKKLALTVGLNLRNIVEHPDVLKKWMSKNEASTVTERINNLLKELPVVDEKWDKPWWNIDVEM
jgi:hypothetical protein